MFFLIVKPAVKQAHKMLPLHLKTQLQNIEIKVDIKVCEKIFSKDFNRTHMYHFLQSPNVDWREFRSWVLRKYKIATQQSKLCNAAVLFWFHASLLCLLFMILAGEVLRTKLRRNMKLNSWMERTDSWRIANSTETKMLNRKTAWSIVTRNIFVCIVIICAWQNLSTHRIIIHH